MKLINIKLNKKKTNTGSLGEIAEFEKCITRVPFIVEKWNQRE